MLNKRLFDRLFREAAFIMLAAISITIANQTILSLSAEPAETSSQMKLIALSTAVGLLLVNFTDYFSVFSRVMGRLNYASIILCIASSVCISALILFKNPAPYLAIALLAGLISGIIITSRQAIKSLYGSRSIQILLDLAPNEKSPVIEDLASKGLLSRVKIMLTDELEEFSEKILKQVDLILISDSSEPKHELSDKLIKALQSGVPIMDYREFCGKLSGRLRLNFTDTLSHILRIQTVSRLSGFYAGMKNFIEPLAAMLLLILSSPLLLVIAVIIRLSGCNSVIVTQSMIGLNQKPFKMLKFRTGTDQTRKWPNYESTQLTRAGHFLKNTGFEKLPMLWNIVRSEMSFIGPQPEHPLVAIRLSERLPQFSLQTLVKPGIISWSKLHNVSSDTKDSQLRLEYDLYYINNLSPAFDAFIIMKFLFSKNRRPASSTCIVELQSDLSDRTSSLISNLNFRL